MGSATATLHIVSKRPHGYTRGKVGFVHFIGNLKTCASYYNMFRSALISVTNDFLSLYNMYGMFIHKTLFFVQKKR